MPGPGERRVNAVTTAVQSGALEESVLDDAVRRILRIAFMAAQTKKGFSPSMLLRIMLWHERSPEKVWFC